MVAKNAEPVAGHGLDAIRNRESAAQLGHFIQYGRGGHHAHDRIGVHALQPVIHVHYKFRRFQIALKCDSQVFDRSEEHTSELQSQ